MCAFAVVAALSTGCAPRQPSDVPWIRTVRIYDMLVDLPKAAYRIHEPDYFKPCDCTVGDQTRSGFVLHPAGRITFPSVRLGEKPVLSFWIAVAETTWSQSGDGVEFAVFVSRANTAGAKVFARYVDPKHNSDDRRWIQARLPLKSFANQDVQISLMTEPGPARDFSFDWALWAEPQIVIDDTGSN